MASESPGFCGVDRLKPKPARPVAVTISTAAKTADSRARIYRSFAVWMLCGWPPLPEPGRVAVKCGAGAASCQVAVAPCGWGPEA